MTQNNDDDLSKYSYDIVKSIADYLLIRTVVRPKIGIICGSGFNQLADIITDRQIFEYSSIPNFPMPNVKGNGGRMNFGFLKSVPVMAIQGRFHYYEGYPLQKCSLPVRLMKLLGIDYVLVTHASGGINANYKVGDIMLIHDHINWFGMVGNSSLRGPNDTRFGPRLLNIVDAYDRSLLRNAIRVAKELGIEESVHVGVYSCVGGPSYETIAELKLLHMVGVDAVGMSTVREVIMARHCGMKVLAFSLITDKCPLNYEAIDPLTHKDNVSVACVAQRQQVYEKFMLAMISEIAREYVN